MITIKLDDDVAARLEEAARVMTAGSVAKVANEVLREWLADTLPKLEDKARLRERLWGRVPCRLTRALVLQSVDSRGVPHKGRWEREAIAWLEPDVARRYAEHLEVLEPPEEEGKDAS